MGGSRRLALAAFVCAALALPGAARANLLWSFSFSGFQSASGNLVTNDTLDGGGFYQVLSMSGSWEGHAILGVSPPGTFGGNDNLISPTDTDTNAPGVQRLTPLGITFSVKNDPGNDGNGHVNFYWGSTYKLLGPDNSLLGYIDFFDAEIIGAIPEPASMTLLGAGLIGLMAARRRKAA